MTDIPSQEIQVLEKQISPLVEKAGSYKIDSVEAINEASVFLKQVKDAETNIENKRLEFTGPLNQSLKAINDTFKQLKAPLEQARILLTSKILVWKKVENERLEKEEARRRAIQEAHKEVGHTINEPIVLERPENKIGNTQTSKVWKWKLVAFSSLDDVYKTTNDVVINQRVREGARQIPGLEIYQEDKLSIVNN